MFAAQEQYPTPLQREQGIDGYLDTSDGKTLARFIALDGDEVVGHVSLSLPIWEPMQRALAGYTSYYEVSRLFTVPSARRSGIARALLSRALEHADAERAAVGLSYFTRVSAGVGPLYAAEGFLPLGNPGDEVAMESPDEPVQIMVRPVRPRGHVLGLAGA
jgi:GNAT superfamily N-acetyltransferase